MSDNYDGPAMAQYIMRLQAQNRVLRNKLSEARRYAELFSRYVQPDKMLPGDADEYTDWVQLQHVRDDPQEYEDILKSIKTLNEAIGKK